MTRNAAFRAQDSLDNIRDYFEDRADASCEPGDDRFRGNKEMSLLTDVEAVENAIAALSQANRAETMSETCDKRMATPRGERCGKPAKWLWRKDREEGTFKPVCGRHAPLTPWSGERKPLSSFHVSNSSTTKE